MAATSAMAIIEAPMKKKWSVSARIAVGPGMSMPAMNLAPRATLKNRLVDTIAAQASVVFSCRSTCVEIRSLSRKRRRKLRVRSSVVLVLGMSVDSRAAGHDVGDVARCCFGIVSEHELRKHVFERMTCDDAAQLFD